MLKINGKGVVQNCTKQKFNYLISINIDENTYKNGVITRKYHMFSNQPININDEIEFSGTLSYKADKSSKGVMYIFTITDFKLSNKQNKSKEDKSGTNVSNKEGWLF